jgi:hypothetical protein
MYKSLCKDLFANPCREIVARRIHFTIKRKCYSGEQPKHPHRVRARGNPSLKIRRIMNCATALSNFMKTITSRKSELTHFIASALRRCESIARSRRLREKQGGFAAATNLKVNYCNTLN